MRPVVLCADDFGYSAGVSRSIAGLAERGRLSAVSCLTVGRAFETSAPRLRDLVDRVDVGLHLALTEFEPSRTPPAIAPDGRLPDIGPLLRTAFAGRLSASPIRDEFLRQLDRFRTVFGRDPAFLDGHQHVHLLPTVRDAVFLIITGGNLSAQATYIRDCRESLAAIASRGIAVGKASFISLLALGFAARAREAGLVSNDSFRGVYDFATSRNIAAFFPRFLQGGGRRPLIMCHPGPPEPEAGDPIGLARAAEFAYMGAEIFQDHLAAAGVGLARMGDCR